MNIMYVYHLMPYTRFASENLELRAPKHRISGEDNALPRICVSGSLDGCLTGIGPHNVYLPFLQDSFDREGIQRGVLPEKIRLPFVLHTYRIRLGDILFDRFWRTKKVEKYVPDARISGECWIIKPMQPESIQIVWLENADIRMVDMTVEGKKCHHPVFYNSRWSDSTVNPTKRLRESLANLTKRAILQFEKDAEQKEGETYEKKYAPQ